MPEMIDMADDLHPRVSVLMSVFNGERHLDQAIESILSQSFDDFEFIIIDDGSTDTSWDILTKASACDTRIRLLRNDGNLGLSRSLNRGLEVAKGAFIARQDADDVAQPERLSRQLALFENAPELVLAGSAYWLIDEEGKPLGLERNPSDDTTIRWQMLFHNSFAHSSIMVRRNVMFSHSLNYNEECRYAQDYELWSRLLDFGSVVNNEEPLISYRVHDNGTRVKACREQQTIASRIAAANVGKLGLLMTEVEMQKLREFYQGKMRVNDAASIHNCCQLVLIFKTFADRAVVDKWKLACINIQLFKEILLLKQTEMSNRRLLSLAWDLFAFKPFMFILAACYAAANNAGKLLSACLRSWKVESRNVFDA